MKTYLIHKNDKAFIVKAKTVKDAIKRLKDAPLRQEFINALLRAGEKGDAWWEKYGKVFELSRGKRGSEIGERANKLLEYAVRDAKPIIEEWNRAINALSRKGIRAFGGPYDLESKILQIPQRISDLYYDSTVPRKEKAEKIIEWIREDARKEEENARHPFDSIHDAPDIAEYQKWVDYDMKHYGHISKETNDKLRGAGLEVIKSEYGDWEVIPKERDGHADDDIEKSGGGWVNRGKEGTHGKFATKKGAREQQKAMFANGYKGDSICDSDIKFLYPIIEFTESLYQPLRDLENKRTTLDKILSTIKQAEQAKDKEELGYDKTYIDLVFSVDGKEKRVHWFRYDIGADIGVPGLKIEIEDFIRDIVSGKEKIPEPFPHDSRSNTYKG